MGSGSIRGRRFAGRRIWAGLGGAIALGLLGWILWPTSVPDPVVRGRPLSAWLAERRVFPDGRLALSGEAAEAVRALGPEAVPALLARLELSDPPVVRWSAFAGRVVSRGRIGRTGREVARERAVLGFRALGPAARPAWPALVAIVLRTGDDFQRRDALNALTGADVATMRLLAGATTDPDPAVRSRAILALTVLGIAPDEVILPTLEGLKADPDAGVRTQAALSVASLLADLPRCAALLQSPDPRRRAALARRIGSFRARARPHLADLEAAAGDPDPAVRLAVAEAIRQIRGPGSPAPEGKSTAREGHADRGGAGDAPSDRPARP